MNKIVNIGMNSMINLRINLIMNIITNLRINIKKEIFINKINIAFKNNQKKTNIINHIYLLMNNKVKDLVVDKDVRCPLCGGEMKKSGSLKGKSKFKCVICGYEL